MKKVILAFVALATMSIVSCNNATEEKAATAHDEHATTEGAVDPNAVLDPVCKMVKTDAWTESAVSHGETFYFCSPVCKEQFEKDPHKYMGAHAH